MPSFITYLRTLRHLRPIQIYGRIWFRLVTPRADSRPAPLLRLLSGGDWVKPVWRRLSLVGPSRFCFLNEIHDLTHHGWDDPALEKLWRYNLHYFDDLKAHDIFALKEWQRALLLRWVRENPPAAGTGWEPYPTSLRIVNWIKWALNGNELPSECVQSLAVQARWLTQRLEVHLLGNHLFANAKALVFAGLFFEGPEARDWLEKGLRILEREVREQILSDGGHFERSTMYHALVLEDMLDLCNVTVAFSGSVPPHWRSMIAAWREQIGPMCSWLMAMCHPDGEISFFNDAAMGIGPTPIELEQYAARLGFPKRSSPGQRLTHLAASGYLRIEQDGAVAMLDVAAVGPDYLTGHAHADTLSFELSLFGQRVFVNSGTSCYGNGLERLRQRGTAAHNTVVVDGQDSSEVWASFRVARRARTFDLVIDQDARELRVSCAHDGYKRLSMRAVHHREWVFGTSTLAVSDRVSGVFEHAEVRFHLHPLVKLDPNWLKTCRGTEVMLQLPKGQRICFSVEGGAFHIEATSWHPEFGCNESNLCLVVVFNHSVIRTQVKWGRAA